MTNFLMVKKMSDILEHTRMTEFKLEKWKREVEREMFLKYLIAFLAIVFVIIMLWVKFW